MELLLLNLPISFSFILSAVHPAIADALICVVTNWLPVEQGWLLGFTWQLK